jgi:hypothetical protein
VSEACSSVTLANDCNAVPDPEYDFDQWQQAVFDLFRSSNMQLETIPLAPAYLAELDQDEDDDSDSDEDSSLPSPDSEGEEVDLVEEESVATDGTPAATRAKLARLKLAKARQKAAKGEGGDDIEDLGAAMPGLKQAAIERMAQEELSDNVAKITLGKAKGAPVPKEVRGTSHLTPHQSRPGDLGRIDDFAHDEESVDEARLCSRGVTFRFVSGAALWLRFSLLKLRPIKV